MHECFKSSVGEQTVNLRGLIQCKFAGKHNLGESRIGQKAGLLRTAYIALCAGMQRYRRQFHAQERHVLYYEGIHSYSVKVVYQTLYLLELFGINDSVECDIDTHPEAVGVFNKSGYILN